MKRKGGRKRESDLDTRLTSGWDEEEALEEVDEVTEELEDEERRTPSWISGNINVR